MQSIKSQTSKSQYSNIQEEEFEIAYKPIMDADKTNFICINFPDESIYYGEIAYMD